MKPNPRIILPLAIVVIAAVVIGGRLRAAHDREILSGTVEATEAQLGFTAPGRIESLPAREGDAAAQGEVLAALDTAEASARRAQATAQVEAARALLDEMQRGSRPEEIAQARAARAAAQQRLADAQQDFDRASELIAKKVVSQQAYDKAKVALDVAKAQFRSADEAAQVVEKGPRKERIDAQRAQLANAEAALAAARAQLSNMVVRAPFAGVVTVRHREPGEIVPAGSPVVSLMNRADRWVRVYVSESRIGAVHTGQKASITSDTFKGKTYDGVVAYVSSEAEFTPKNVQTAEERVKLVYAVKVRVVGDAAFELKPGMPADVRLEASAK